MGVQPYYGKGPHVLLWAGSGAALGKITISGIHNCLNYCVIFIVYFIYECGSSPHKTTWQSVGWGPMCYLTVRQAVILNIKRK